MWACVTRDIETNVVRLITAADLGTTLDLDRFERHNVPVTVTEDVISLGIHTPDRMCACHPRIVEDGYGYAIVAHREAVN